MEKSNGNGKKPLVKRVEKFLTSDVWNVSESAEGAKKYFLSLLRIVLTTINGIIHKRILVQAPPTDPAWSAVNDRLGRAAAEKNQLG